ncbi:PIH1 domain-containing protein 1 [Oopsacas minuta]|uniref:PIH1 domain-containing protein 1 n=1 Tax=Oopsacas minuta TaxID=111878 RepID=A0AAV7KKM0_9METZ|nr:PIH1 domain-containing protein 1 [Oopsacas minuta]
MKSILDAAYWIIKQMPNDCNENTHKDELESLFTQLNHERIDNPIILFNLFSRFPKFQTDLHRELNLYDNSLKDMKELRDNIIPFYCKGDFSKKISTLPSLIAEQDNIMTKRNTIQTASIADKIQTQVVNYINSVVNESVTHGICAGYSYKFEYLCLVNPEEVLQSIKYYFSQDHRHNPIEKINWRKLFNSVEPVPSTIKLLLYFKMDTLPDNLLSQLVTSPSTGDNLPINDTTPQSINILPTPVFCLKTKLNNTNDKIFINVCTSDQMKKPPDVTDEELIKIIRTQDCSQYRVPLSLGEPRTELDRSHNACVVYDVIVHSCLYTESQKRPIMMEFLLLLLVEGLEAKYDIELNREMRRMQNIKCMGTPTEHRIRTQSKPRIEMEENDDVIESNTYSPLITEVNTNTQSVSSPIPEYTLTKDPPDTHPEYIVLEAKLPLLKSSKHVELNIGEDRIVLTAHPDRYHLDLCLPYYVIPGQDGRDIFPSIFETVCRLVFQYDPEYLIPFINKCQHLLDVDCSKEPAFMRKSSHAQTYQRALESLPDLSYLLSGNQELTTSKAITYYKVLNNSKTLNSGIKCIQILAAVSEWKTALNVLQQYTQNDYLHFYLFTTLSYLMNKVGVLSDFSEELYLMKTNNYR